MSAFEKLQKAAALKYSDLSPDGAPIVVASGMGCVAQGIVDAAEKNGVPVFRDDSLATLLSRMESGTRIPPELYQAIVDIYIYFLGFSVDSAGRVTRAEPPSRAVASAGTEDGAVPAGQPEQGLVFSGTEAGSVPIGQPEPAEAPAAAEEDSVPADQPEPEDASAAAEEGPVGRPEPAEARAAAEEDSVPADRPKTSGASVGTEEDSVPADRPEPAEEAAGSAEATEWVGLSVDSEGNVAPAGPSDREESEN